jgi:hypothetical protein
MKHPIVNMAGSEEVKRSERKSVEDIERLEQELHERLSGSNALERVKEAEGLIRSEDQHPRPLRRSTWGRWESPIMGGIPRPRTRR